jgi:hypothetical protein
LILFFDDHIDLFMPFKEALLVPLQPKKWKREKFENCQKKSRVRSVGKNKMSS